MTQVEQALSLSVVDIDASRRVGWARFYAEAVKAEDLARDLNVAIGDRNMLAGFAARLYGILERICPDSLDSMLPAEMDATLVVSILPERELKKGKAIGRSWLRSKKWSPGDKAREANAMFERARLVERQRLRLQYGIPSGDALHDWLSRYKEEHS